MSKIHVDEQVMAELKRRADGRTPNAVIRELLGLSLDEDQDIEPGVYLVPHGAKEFKTANELRQFLHDLKKNRNGEYLVASLHYWRNVIPGSICLFHKNKNIVGEGKMLGGLVSPYPGTEVSPQTSRRYAGVVHFASIMVYDKPIPFGAAEKLLGKTFSFQAIQKLTSKDYEMLQQLVSNKSTVL